MVMGLHLPERFAFIKRLYLLLEVLAVPAGLALLAAQYGLKEGEIELPGGFPPYEIALLIFFALRVPAVYLFTSRLKTAFLGSTSDTIIFLLSTTGFALTPLAPDPATARAYGAQLALLTFCIFKVFTALRAVQRLKIPPLFLFALTFAVIILAGAGLLMLPRAHTDITNVSFVNALFMSTSATCVTGLSVYDIGTQFTTFGQLVILALIQIGGLGIMTFAAFFAVAFGSGMSLRDRAAMSEVLSYETIGKIGNVVFWILGLTFVIEVAGAVLLYGHWVSNTGVPLETGNQIYYSIFHSISAFCNAGFSLHGDGLVRYDGQWPVLLPIGGLIVFGGLGFTVIMDLLMYKPWHHPLARRLPVVGRHLRRYPLPRLTLQTKLVLVMTALLIAGGAFGYWLLERNGVMSGHSPDRQVLGSIFQGGITPRTAGFNSHDYCTMSAATWFFTICLMFIGASPGSTGGGIKTTTTAVLTLAVWKLFRNRPIEAFKRRIADDQVRNVLVLLAMVLALLTVSLFILCLTEEAILAKPNGFLRILFETVSSFGTVGLSTGITMDLSPAGKYVLVTCMFFGRIGPLTLILALGKRKPAAFDYPGESVMLG